MSTPLIAMEQEAPQRANPCTQLKTAFMLGLALFAGKSIYDCRTLTPDMLDSTRNSAITTVGGNVKTVKIITAVDLKTPKAHLEKPFDLKELLGIDADDDTYEAL